MNYKQDSRMETINQPTLKNKFKKLENMVKQTLLIFTTTLKMMKMI